MTTFLSKSTVGSTGAPSASRTTVTTTSAPCKSSSSKARLLFNTDGSVKLLGDPSFLPGTGIDGNSHNLIPTVGPDGKMTMLLTPAHGLGKTFILSPTNGASLPNANTILCSDTNLTSSNSAKPTTSVLLPCQTVQSAKNIPKTTSAPVSSVIHRPLVIKTSDKKHAVLPSQKSLLSGLNGTSSSTSKDFVTHMRIDPSGSSVSTVKVPATSTHTSGAACASKNMFGSTVLKNIAEKVKPSTQNKTSSQQYTACQTGNTKYFTVYPSKSTEPASKATDNKDPSNVSVYNKQWTKLNSIMPTNTSNSTTPTIVYPSTMEISTNICTKPSKSQLGCGNNLIMMPQSIPVPNTSGTYTVIFAPPSLQAGQQVTQTVSSNTVSIVNPSIFNSNAAGNSNNNTLTALSASVPGTVNYPYGTNTTSLLSGVNNMPKTTIPPVNNSNTLQFVIKDGQLVQVEGNGNVPQKANSTGGCSQKLISVAASVPLNKTPANVSENPSTAPGNIILNAVGGRFVPANTSVVTESSSEADKAKVSGFEDVVLDPVTGCLVKDGVEMETSKDAPETNDGSEDGVMTIKIDSVFSLSTKDVADVSASETMDREDETDSEVHVKQENMEEDDDPPSLDDEPKTVTCHPSYVVLEQLSTNQIENPEKCVIKCSDYCRARTLNFLCGLGLVNCKPTVHTMNPVKKKEDAFQSVDKRSRFQKKGNKRRDCSGTRDKGSGGVGGMKQQREDEDTSAQSKLSPEGADATKSTQALNTANATTVTSPKVRKVESPGSPITKVITFTKIEKEKAEKIVFKKKQTAPTDKSPCNPLYPNNSGSELKTNQTVSSVPKIVSPESSKPEHSPVTVHVSKVIQGNPPVELATNLKSMLPMTKLVASNNKQYFLFNLKGQKILVPASNDMQKPKAFVLKGNSPELCAKGTTAPVSSLSKIVSSVGKLSAPSTNLAQQICIQKRQLNSASESKKPTKFAKTASSDGSVLPGAMKIKTEPVTHGYGDEEPPKLTKKKKNSCVKVKQEPADTEWQEIWSSVSRPVADPSVECEKTNLAKAEQTKETSNDNQSEDEVPMPDLPMMKVPSTKEIAQKTAAHNDRIERLKAMLREKEKLIEDLKIKRLRDGPVLDDIEISDTQYRSHDSGACGTEDKHGEVNPLGELTSPTTHSTGSCALGDTCSDIVSCGNDDTKAVFTSCATKDPQDDHSSSSTDSVTDGYILDATPFLKEMPTGEEEKSTKPTTEASDLVNDMK